MNQDIYKTVRDRIMRLEYGPGDILNEQVLATEFGVSRTPMRDVLTRLEWERLVRILPRTGTLVTEIELNQIMNVFQIRLEIEDLVGRLAAQRFTQVMLAQLDRLRQDCDRLFHNKDRNALAAIDMGIKELFYQAADNPVLAEISDRLYALTFRLWYLNMDKGDWNEEVSALAEELSELAAALSSPNPSEMGALRRNRLVKHLDRIRNKFLGLAE